MSRGAEAFAPSIAKHIAVNIIILAKYFIYHNLPQNYAISARKSATNLLIIQKIVIHAPSLQYITQIISYNLTQIISYNLAQMVFYNLTQMIL